MYRYIVSFGPKKNRSSVSFVKFKYAESFFNKLISEGALSVQMDTVDDTVYLSEGEAFLRKENENER